MGAIYVTSLHCSTWCETFQVVYIPGRCWSGHTLANPSTFPLPNPILCVGAPYAPVNLME